MAGHVKSGAVKSFAIWNPIDLGYSSIHLAHALVKGAKAAPGEKLKMGRVGTATLDKDNEAAMAEPFTYDASNVEQFAKIF
jgi:rhamnose transport system substrate-binding protein